MNRSIEVIIKEVREAELKAEEAIKSHKRYLELKKELLNDLCKIVKLEDLRPMTKEDIFVGQLVFGEYDGEIYVLIIEDIIGFSDLNFKSFEADDGCRYGIYEHYVLK